MSRTYRMRGTARHIAKKWVNCTGAMSLRITLRDNATYALLAHGIMQFPCAVVGLPLIEIRYSTYTYQSKKKNGPDGLPLLERRRREELIYHSHWRCLILGGFTWETARMALEMLQVGPHSVAPLYRHPYARPLHRSDRNLNKLDNKAQRRSNRMLLWKVIKTDDLDGI